MSFVFVGDDTGLIKKVRVRDSAIVLRYGQQLPGKGITNMAWAGDTADTREQRILVSHANGSLALYDEQTSQMLAERAGTDAIVGLAVITLDTHSGLAQQPTIVTCTAKGQLTLTPLTQLTSPTPPTSSPPATPTSFSLGDNIAHMRLCPLPTASVVASGGKEQLVRLHDLSTQQCTFKAKNVPHNKLNLRTPVHTTDIVWLPNSDTQLIEGTAHHAVRLYDIRAGKQPVLNVNVGEHAVTSLAVTGDGLQFIAADVTGRVVNVDRRRAIVTSAYHGIGGSVRSIALTADDSQLATASLDRHLRLYDRQTRKMSKKLYLKQKLNVCLWSTQVDSTAAAAVKDEEDEGEVGEEGEEEMWRELDDRRKLAAKKRRVKEEEKEDDDVKVLEKQPGAPEGSGSKRPRLVAVKEEEEEDGGEDFAVGNLDGEERDEEDEDEVENEELDEEEDEEDEEQVELPLPPPSRKKTQPVRRAK